MFGRSLQILKELYEPGADTGRVPLVQAGEEAGIVLRGRLEVAVEEERRILRVRRPLLFRKQASTSFPLRWGGTLRSHQCMYAANFLTGPALHLAISYTIRR
jgi:hypothetical protein